jgi:hypothetical protein
MGFAVHPLYAAEKIPPQADKEAQLSEPKASSALPAWGDIFSGTPKGLRTRVAFFWLLFLARQEK